VEDEAAHTIECVVYGPPSPTATDDDVIATRILGAKAAGITTVGTTSRTIYDTEGFSRAVRFSRPTQIDISPSISLVKSPEAYAGDAAVRAAIAGIVWSPGVDCSWDLIVGAARTVPGVLRVSTVDLGSGPFTTIPISLRQIASIDSADVTVTSSDGIP
jgi:hypothetical protein